MQNTQFILTLLFKIYTFYTSFFMGSQNLCHFFTEGSISKGKRVDPVSRYLTFLLSDYTMGNNRQNWSFFEAGETACFFKTIAALAENPSSAPSLSMAVHKCL